ncbi:hypothetical protein C5167_004840 [Papaver somniferum]|uniref:Uncharacterized protein n=1 Tax=Papaver somniferum TaxID=3469 RepID=A0A4Y7JCB0_PAPSO|nr:hypothetical protein C5167_004840 [Papaver somniferum]
MPVSNLLVCRKLFTRFDIGPILTGPLVKKISQTRYFFNFKPTCLSVAVPLSPVSNSSGGGG